MSAFESYFSTQLGQFFKKIMSCMPVFEALTQQIQNSTIVTSSAGLFFLSKEKKMQLILFIVIITDLTWLQLHRGMN